MQRYESFTHLVVRTIEPGANELSEANQKLVSFAFGLCLLELFLLFILL